ncbi:MAG: galactokinase family protein, partial [Chitinivibrionales bacterium]|nr:galactokinase family protein [Chitinivibrionales bacterium]
MPSPEKITEALANNATRQLFEKLYGTKPGVYKFQTERYRSLLQRFAERFPDHRDVGIFSVPGRTEVGGNHTDHNGGRVLAAAIDLDVVAVAAP